MSAGLCFVSASWDVGNWWLATRNGERIAGLVGGSDCWAEPPLPGLTKRQVTATLTAFEARKQFWDVYNHRPGFPLIQPLVIPSGR